MKHTRGPWVLLEVGEGSIKRLCPATDDGVSVLTVASENGSAFGAVYCAADARLIAAAPDLLEALTALLNRIELEGCTPLDWPEFEAGRAAIAKAIGEQE